MQYHQSRAASVSELERRLESAGYGVGLKVLEMTAYRTKEVGIDSLHAQKYYGDLCHSLWLDQPCLKLASFITSPCPCVDILLTHK